MHLGNGGAGIRAELNLTPMIDVVLVLLIIFMVVTPKKDLAVPVLSADEKAAPQVDNTPPPDSPIIDVDEKGAWKVSGVMCVERAALEHELKKKLSTQKEKVVFLQAADDAPYERVAIAVDTARSAGALHVGLVRTRVP